MKLPDTAQTSRPWRIHELTRDFRLEDVWALPTPGGPDDFPRLVRLMASFDPERSAPGPVRALWAIRWKVGGLLGWDDPKTGVDARVPTLRDRLPADLRDAPRGPDFDDLPFSSLYLTDDEWAAEIANRTMHGVMHVGWVPDERGGHRGQMAVYVKPNGLLGQGYMAAIRPFRHLLVYPAMIRAVGRAWQRGGRASQMTLSGLEREVLDFMANAAEPTWIFLKEIPELPADRDALERILQHLEGLQLVSRTREPSFNPDGAPLEHDDWWALTALGRKALQE